MSFKDGLYRGREKKMSRMRCACNWIKTTILGLKITKPLTLTSGEGDSESAQEKEGKCESFDKSEDYLTAMRRGCSRILRSKCQLHLQIFPL